MRLTIVLLVALLLVGCAGLTTTTSVNSQLDKEKQQLQFIQRFIVGVDLDPSVLEKLSPDQITSIYTAMASAGMAPGGSLTFEPHLEFHQSQGTDARSAADLQAEMRANIEATMRDLITSPAP